LENPKIIVYFKKGKTSKLESRVKYPKFIRFGGLRGEYEREGRNRGGLWVGYLMHEEEA